MPYGSMLFDANAMSCYDTPYHDTLRYIMLRHACHGYVQAHATLQCAVRCGASLCETVQTATAYSNVVQTGVAWRHAMLEVK